MTSHPRRGILIIVQNLPVPQDRRVWLEATSLVADGHTVSVIAFRGPGQRWIEERDGVGVYRYPKPPEASGMLSYVFEFAYCWLMTALLSLVVLAKRGFHVVHACNPPDTYFLLGAFYKVFGKKFVFDQHDLCPEMYLARFGDGHREVLYRSLRALERLTYRTADLVISTNDSYRALAIDRGGRTLLDTVVVRSGPSLKSFVPVEPDLSLRGGFEHMVAYVGVINPQDALSNAIHAMDYIVHECKRSDIGLVVLGTGSDLARVQRLTVELSLEQYVRFVGWCNTSEMLRYLSSATVGVVPDPKDPYSDQSTHNKVLEYMAAGIPMAAFDLTEVRRSAGDAAVYASPNDTADLGKKLLELIDSPLRRHAMGLFARQRFLTELAWEHSEGNLLKSYRALLRPSDVPPAPLISA